MLSLTEDLGVSFDNTFGVDDLRGDCFGSTNVEVTLRDALGLDFEDIQDAELGLDSLGEYFRDGLCTTNLGEDLRTDAGVVLFEDLNTEAGVTLGEDLGAEAGVTLGEDLGAEAGAALGEDLGAEAGVAIGEDLGIDAGVVPTEDLSTEAKVALRNDLDTDVCVTLGEDLGVDIKLALFEDLDTDVCVALGKDFDADVKVDLSEELGADVGMASCKDLSIDSDVAFGETDLGIAFGEVAGSTLVTDFLGVILVKSPDTDFGVIFSDARCTSLGVALRDVDSDLALSDLLPTGLGEHPLGKNLGDGLGTTNLGVALEETLGAESDISDADLQVESLGEILGDGSSVTNSRVPLGGV